MCNGYRVPVLGSIVQRYPTYCQGIITFTDKIALSLRKQGLKTLDLLVILRVIRHSSEWL